MTVLSLSDIRFFLFQMMETIEALLGQYDQEVTENTIGAINERDEVSTNSIVYIADNSIINVICCQKKKKQKLSTYFDVFTYHTHTHTLKIDKYH